MCYALLYITTSCKIFSKNLRNLTIVYTIPDFLCKMPLGRNYCIKKPCNLSGQLNFIAYVTVISFDALAEFILGEERHNLCEDCFAFIHGLQELALMPFRKLTSSNRKIIFAM